MGKQGFRFYGFYIPAAYHDRAFWYIPETGGKFCQSAFTLPLGPTRAVTCPCFAVKETLCKICSWVFSCLYEKETF
jgi:hypothetical protein